MDYIFLPCYFKTIMSCLLFITLVVEMMLFILKISNDAPLKKCLNSGVVMAINGALLFCTAKKEPMNNFTLTVKHLPWIVYSIIILLIIVYLIFAFEKEKKRGRKNLTPNSVREAIDDLQMGICFADPFGHVVLVNRKMQELAVELFGYCPQILSEVTDNLTAFQNSSFMTENCVRTQKGEIYRFRVYIHVVDGVPGWKQIVAHDITKLHIVGEQLRLENEKLKKINGELLKMYERMSDDIKKKEILKLKVYVHDTIGRSIITVQDIMQSNEGIEQKVHALKEAVDELSGRRTTCVSMLEEAKQAAAKIGIKVKINGELPKNAAMEGLMATATRECATNCLKHAAGNEITVTVNKENSNYCVTITNNGEKPKAGIIEGSGLSSLRHCVEAEGGYMKVFHYPEFCLILKLKGEDNR